MLHVRRAALLVVAYIMVAFAFGLYTLNPWRESGAHDLFAGWGAMIFFPIEPYLLVEDAAAHWPEPRPIFVAMLFLASFFGSAVLFFRAEAASRKRHPFR